MPDPYKLHLTLGRAVVACRATAGRTGRFIDLQDVDEVFVAGDLHGNVEHFRTILQRAELARFPRRHLVIQELVHGPHRYPLGGDKSHQLVDLFAALKCQYPRQVHFLLGNHELAQWTGQRIAKGNASLLDEFRAGLDTAYGAQAEMIYAMYLDLFAVVPVMLRTPNRVLLSHSLPDRIYLKRFDPNRLRRDESDPDDVKLGGSIHALVWGRDTSAANTANFLGMVDAELLVSGHIPCDDGFETPNDRQLILDSQGMPGAVCLFRADRAVKHAELVAGVQML